jgi:hypothetical protein
MFSNHVQLQTKPVVLVSDISKDFGTDRSSTEPAIYFSEPERSTAPGHSASKGLGELKAATRQLILDTTR